MPPSEPSVEALILDKIETLQDTIDQRMMSSERHLNDRLDAHGWEVNRRFTTQDQALASIKEQTQLTNGRVTTLEKAHERAQGVIFAYGWFPPVMGSLVTAGLTLLVMALTGSLR